MQSIYNCVFGSNISCSSNKDRRAAIVVDVFVSVGAILVCGIAVVLFQRRSTF